MLYRLLWFFFFWGSRGGEGMRSCDTIPVGYGEL